MIPRSPFLLSRHDSALLVVDVQTKLLTLIPGYERVVFNIGRIVDGASLFQIPTIATEQYPKGLGGTDESIRGKLSTPAAKVRFSCGECADLILPLHAQGREKIVVVGIETHVCVFQTALDLVANGFDIFVVVDAVAARGELDHDIALRRLEGQGVTLTTTESVLFEWCESADAAEFKQVSQLIRQGSPSTS